MKKFLNGNEWYWRLLRTIVQGLIGVVIANIDLIVGAFNFEPTMKPIVVALIMAVLSPIMAELGKKIQAEEVHQEAEEKKLDEPEEDLQKIKG